MFLTVGNKLESGVLYVVRAIAAWRNKKLLEDVFSTRSVPRCYKQDKFRIYIRRQINNTTKQAELRINSQQGIHGENDNTTPTRFRTTQ
jgi:hypothetical protein